tara:strand:+ start:578 stop:1282 length:705 start_codon:yes stop_codon:yes gene_type:complete
MKKIFFTILILFVASCSPPEPGTDEWYEEKYNEFIEAIPSSNLSFEEFMEILNFNEDDKLLNDTEKNMTLVTIKTSVGEIKLELNDEKAPITVENFKNIVSSGYYEGTIFHRVINDFMVQGGGLTADMNNKSSGTAPIQNEANNGLSNDRGTVAMARTMEPHSATSQFFINHKDNEFLNHTGETSQGWGYAVFGKVTEGMDVIDQIANVETGSSGMYQDVPVDVITIESVTISE